MLSLSRRQTTDANLDERIQAILASRGLSLYHVSQQSAIRFGRSSPHFLPHNFYYALRQAAFTPSIFQVFALSDISGYRLSDWLRVFGIELEDVPRLQTLLPRKRTTLIDALLTDSQAWVRWFRTRASDGGDFATAPLAQFLETGAARRIASLPGGINSKFLYAKIGARDVLAFPDLLSGSIVRINPQLTPDCFPTKDGATSKRLFLLEHSKGLSCCRVRRLREDLIMPIGTKLSYAQVELRVPSQARIHGVIDFEIRSLLENAEPQVAYDLARVWKPSRLVEPKTFGQLLSGARTKASLSFREAAAVSQSVSKALGDKRYRISPSSLCDYEVQGTPPRSLHRVIALCCLYGVAFRSVLVSLGFQMENAEMEPMPDSLLGRSMPGMSGAAAADSAVRGQVGFLERMLEECQETPFFLRNAIAPFAGLREISLDDCFWIGGEQHPTYPYLANSVVAIVNHRRKIPFHFPSKPVWKQPVYLLVQRDGTHLCACCDVQNSTLVIRPYTEQFSGALQFRYPREIEVVGQIVAIARRMA